MVQSTYTLTDLVDLSLKIPEVGAVNFNILHTVLQTMLVELGLENVRPACRINHPLLDRTELARARMRGDTTSKAQHSQDSIRMTRSEEPLKKVSGEMLDEAEKDSDSAKSSSSAERHLDEHDSNDSQETSSPPPNTPPTQESGKTEEEQTSKEDKEHKEKWSDQMKARMKHSREDDDSQGAAHAWKFTNLDSRVEAIEEGLMRLADIVDMIADKIRKLEAKKPQGSPIAELEELQGKVTKLEEAIISLQEAAKKRSSGASSAELEGLEDRIEALEEAKLLFDQDHETLAEVVKTQKDMLQEFEEIKALGNEIKDMKNEIASKAGLKEMEEALALKGDLSLVLTKVDQVEFETAVEELGEAIGTLGIKFQKKNEEWEEKCADVWKGIDSKMSRDVFDQAMAKFESRLIAVMRALNTLKKVVEQLLYPDSSGVTRCILCRRPAAISGHECLDNRYSPKRHHKSSTESSDDSFTKNNFMKNVDKAMKKRQRIDGPPFDAHRDTIISIPYCSSTYRTEPRYEKPIKEPQLKLAPISRKNGQRYADQADIGRSQIPKLPEINGKEDLHSSSKSTREIQISVPDRSSRLPHRRLVFTQKMLDDSNRVEKQRSEDEEENDSTSASETDSASTPSRERSPTSATTDIMNDSLRNMDSFTPLRLMQDPLRRQIIRSPNTKHQQRPVLNLAPLYPAESSSSRD